MTERQAADAFVKGAIQGALTAISNTWPVWPDSAQDGAVGNYVIFANSASLETTTNGSLLLMSEFPYTVRAVMQGNTSAIDPVEAAIHDALAGPLTSGNRLGIKTVQNGFIIDCKRTGNLSNVSPRMSKNWRFAGGTFLVKIRPQIT